MKNKLDTVYKLHLGSGDRALPGYLNTDILLYDKADMVLDMSKTPYPFEAESLYEIYSSHVIEHVEPDLVLPMMKEWYRILRPYGKAVVEWPDLDGAIALYLQGNVPLALQMLYGEINKSQPVEPQRHKAGYSIPLMVKLFQDAGFSKIERVPSVDYHLVECGIPTSRVEATK